ncbi:transcriptional regulator, Spx/MgsR family [Sulfurivirga caldicuralii]|uniref:Transcriptional regulator, Spx/MgsR family n=1 Tax=Sulfurivirga caldicuralii TaxID=364032 RepID=A0A1N6EVS6_9GAMM|nr:Spx/MgsR family RNA polymerase-binding regulatory protein [Sulfurivirga caldicuralii]SIN87096.1 transcriptional regulator, Spx/MgsR family [Sulfurivirga caldicuralii]
MSEIILYGIPNCDKVRAARKWLEERGVLYRFWDLRKDGLDEALLQRWLQAVGLKTLVNTRSATWRQLDGAARAAILNGDLQGLAAHPTLIKRPLLDVDGQILVGFDPERWAEVLA